MCAEYSIEKAPNGEVAIFVPTIEYDSRYGFVTRVPKEVLDKLGVKDEKIIWHIFENGGAKLYVQS